MNHEITRNNYKPDKVKILFVGESCPKGGTFFYNSDSNLYKYTKQAFEQANKDFSLEHFKKYGCWLYDVCDVPVNGLQPHERREKIKLGLPLLLTTIDELAPQYIIVVKKGDMRDIIFKNVCDCGYMCQERAFNISFPSCGRQTEYQNELTEIIKKIIV
jgi:hypothetical protein